jgi:putative peptidoglycan lipid II flippase
MSQETRYLGSARIIAFCTVISRVTGLARDMTLNHVFGQNWIQDAFNYGFQIPNLFRRLFGEGALSAVFVPTFTEVLDKRGRPAAWVLLGRVAGLMALCLAVLTVMCTLGAIAVWWWAPGDQMRTLQAGLTAAMMPFMMSVCLLALFSSILNCVQHFTVPALMPVVLNVMMIFGAVVIGPLFGERLEVQVYGLAVSVLVASVIQLCAIFPVLRRHGVRFRWSLDHSDPDVRRIGRIFLPVLLGQGILLLNVFFDNQLCTFLTRGPQQAETRSLLCVEFKYPLAEGALSAVNNAQRLYQFPLGVLAISLATAALPLFSLYASRGDMQGLRASFGQSIRMAVFEGLPSGIVLIILAEPIIALLFEHGRYDHNATLRAAWVLRWYSIGMAAFCCQHIVIRGFYSLKDTMTPMWIACYLVILNVILNVTLVWHPAIREAAFGIGTSITALLNVGISMWLLRRRMQGRVGARALLRSLLQTALASAVASVVAYLLIGVVGRVDLHVLGTTGTRAVHVFVPLLCCMIAYLAVAKLLRMEELRWVLGRHG